VRTLRSNEAGLLLRGRVQVINLGRPVQGHCRHFTRSLRRADRKLVASDLIYPNRTGETYSVTFDRKHHWFCVAEMSSDEVLLLECHGSQIDGRARFMLHTAYADPTTPARRARATVRSASSSPIS
jgi:hypothetical protein